MPPKARTKPTIRILHHLARSGGTLISKCIATMDRVALLSEIHPIGATAIHPRLRIDPFGQAYRWHGLVGDADVKRLKQRPPTFQQLMFLLEQRAAAKNKLLVLRDWSHLDYTGVPFCEPRYSSMLADVFAGAYEVKRVCTVRHPIDQYLSLLKLPLVAQAGLSVERYLVGCEKFAELCAQTGFIRYEDFTREPDASLRTICDALAIPFDPGYVERWPSYTKITGDRQGSRGGLEVIRPLDRRAAPDELIDEFKQHDAYHRSKELLGYTED